jgi:pimeloyl-ACP methyl ester carboxylesterase
MRRILKVTRLVLLSLLALFVVLVVAFLLLRAHRQHQTAETIAIRTPNGIDEARYVRIGGIDQWIQIRGQDRGNPVLLCLHGGPGGTWIPLTALFVPWEKEFTIVQWDQRGAGKTLETTGRSVADTMSVDRMAQDGIELSEFLRSRLHKDKIILLGHSWGSLLGIHMTKQRPDLFYAYVGTGQISRMPRSMQLSYEYLLGKARAANDKEAVEELERIGPPPYDGMDKAIVHFKWHGVYQTEVDRAALSSLPGGLTSPAPNYSLWDECNRIRGFAQIPTWRTYQEMLSADLPSLGTDFKIPVFFFQGVEDELTVTALVKEYFDRINAPHKEMVLIEGAGHFAVWSRPDRFLQELITRVRPLAVEPGDNGEKRRLD